MHMLSLILNIRLPIVTFAVIARAVLICALLLFGFDAQVVQAQYATGGTGLHRNRILWIDWGANGENVYAGKSITRTVYIDTPNTPANKLDIICTLSNAATTRGTAGLFVYPSGNWQGDGLDELYNIGGNQPGSGANPNTLTAGLRTNAGSTVEFDFTCNATLGGQPFALTGLVFADAEASGGTEYVAARLTGGGALRIIDQISQCGTSSTVNVLAGSPQEIRLQGPTTPQASCESNANPLLRAGPSLVGFIDGATSGRVIVRGGGISAVAVGAVIEMEFSEALPTSYGNASHILDPNWNGVLATSGVNYNNPANLATPVYQLYLGSSVIPDIDANGAIGGSDVNALPKKTGPAGAGYADIPSPQGAAGSTYAINSVSCFGPGFVAGWIDFNGNGVFDSGEKSNVATCGTGASTVTLNFTIPAGGTTPQTSSFMRLRIASNTAGVTDASGVANNGEAEDYRITVGGAQLRLQKTWANANAGDISSLQTTGLANNATLSATTVSGNDTQQSAQFRAYVGETALITETLGASNVGYYGQALSCTGASDTNLADGLTVSATDTDIVCTITNTRRIVTATSDSASGVNGVAGASNVLNVLTGDAVAGVAATAANAVLSVASGSSVPAQLTFNAATGAVGVVAGTPAGSYTFNYQICDVVIPANCTTATASVTVAPSVDLQVNKTNGTITVFSASSTTYTVTVTNTGPDSTTGAVVTDVPGAGINCPSANAVTITGNGVPPGSYTIANLTGAGITLGTLGSGQSATLTYTCQVN